MALTAQQKAELLRKFPTAGPSGDEGSPEADLGRIRSIRESMAIDKKPQEFGGLLDPAIGAIKGATGTLQNIGNVVAKPVGKLFGVKEEDIGFTPEQLEAKNTLQKVGKFGEQVAEFAVPISKVGTATKGLSGIAKLAPRALTSGAVATAQEGEIGTGTAVATGLELAFPAFGKVMKPIKRLFVSLGSGLSGVSTQTLKSVAENPAIAKKTFEEIAKEGGDKIIRRNANVILKGISKIKKESSKAYGEALEKLGKENISKVALKKEAQSALKESGISAKGGVIRFTNSDILDTTIQKRAKNLITQINNQKDFSGKGVRNIMKLIEGKKFKTAGGDANRLAFNKFADALDKGFRKAIAKSTPIMEKANKAYSKDRDIVDAIQAVFSKTKFNQTSDLIKVANRLEGLFAKKGIAPKEVDRFLTRIGVSPSEFRTTESVRKLMSVEDVANAKGINISEVIRSLTSSTLTPEVIGRIATMTNLEDSIVKKIFTKVAPTMRATLLEILVSSSDERD